MKKRETISLIQYLFFHQSKLEQAVRDCHIRFTRRDLDSVDLLEEIIAKERLNEFNQVTEDILNILNLTDNEFSLNSICVKCNFNTRCPAQESEKFRDSITNLVVDCCKFKP